MIVNTKFNPNRRNLNIAVVGGGIAGMSAAWLLNKRHQIKVFELNDYIGGHSNTVDVSSCGHLIPVDTGFIVYNEKNYPNLECYSTGENYGMGKGNNFETSKLKINVSKPGISSFIFKFAHKYSFIYGIFSAIIAIGLGFLAGVVFRK